MVLRQLRLTSEHGDFARGAFLAAYVDITAQSTGLFEACLTLFPYDQRWSTVRGVALTLVGQDTDHNLIPGRMLRTGWDGGLNFPDLPAGEYQVLLAEESHATEWEILAETAQVLRQMPLQAERTASAEGTFVRVGIDSHWNADHHTLCVRISCYAFAHRQVNWRKLAVAVAGTDPRATVRHIARFDATGLALFPTLPPAEYTLSVYERTETFVQAPRLPGRASAPRGRGRSARQGEVLAAHPQVPGPQEGVPDLVLREPRTTTSADGKIAATLIPSAEGIIVAFQTQAPELAEQTVVFTFVTEAGEPVVAPGEVVLHSQEPGTALWEGEWPHAVPLDQPCELLFQVRPPA